METSDQTIRFPSPETKRKKLVLSILGVVAMCLIGIAAVGLYRRVTPVKDGGMSLQPTPTPDPLAPRQALLLGYGGPGHDGGLLSDTMILARIVPKEKKVFLISIPRDVWVMAPVKEATASGYKINAVYAIGSDDRAYPNKPAKYQGDGGGLRMAKDVVGTLIGTPVDWAVAVDFSGFKAMLGILGGIFVEVPFAFEDQWYPLEGKATDTCGKSEEDIQRITATLSGELVEREFPCRYETLKFEKGKQFMDADTALKFVRSRHSTVNGGDFGRSLRQQAFLQGVKNRLLSFQGMTKLLPLVQKGLEMVDTDLIFDDLKTMLERYGDIASYTMSSIHLTDQTVLDFSMSPDGQSVLVPKAGEADWESIAAYIDQEIARQETATESSVIQ